VVAIGDRFNFTTPHGADTKHSRRQKTLDGINDFVVVIILTAISECVLLAWTEPVRWDIGCRNCRYRRDGSERPLDRRCRACLPGSVFSSALASLVGDGMPIWNGEEQPQIRSAVPTEEAQWLEMSEFDPDHRGDRSNKLLVPLVSRFPISMRQPNSSPRTPSAGARARTRSS